jgi:hypothetical protein
VTGTEGALLLERDLGALAVPSWLRDAIFESWDAVRKRWVRVQELLSDAPVHTHLFAQPVESPRFRIILSAVQRNLRLAEIVFHGERRGNPHPDAAAKPPVAVLFDEGNQLAASGFAFRFEGAYSGGRCIELRKDGKFAPRTSLPSGTRSRPGISRSPRSRSRDSTDTCTSPGEGSLRRPPASCSR